MRCLNNFLSKEALSKHDEYCSAHEAVSDEYPKDKEGNPVFLKFNNGHRSTRVPCVIYADFEAIIEPTHTCQPNADKSYTTPCQKHTPLSCTYYVKFLNDVHPPKLVEYTLCTEKNVAVHL